jgi:hypothetical protein
MRLMRRRPLLRAAALSGTQYMAGKRSAQLDRSPGGLSTEAVEQLKSLAQLHDHGILTDQEFEQQKAKILAG